MRYESERDLTVILRELSDISREMLLKLEMAFKSNLPCDGKLISVTDRRNAASLDIVRILLKYKTPEQK